METKELKPATKTKQKIQLVKGEFNSSEAFDILIALIDEKINFHKLQRLQVCEGNHFSETDELDGRIKELVTEKQRVKTFLAETRDSGKNYEINGVLEIKIVD